MLGTGAFGTVYLTRHITLNVLRAVKCINIYQNNCDTAYREADILKNLRHPSIPIIYDIEQDSEHIYVIEEYIEGMSLTQLISQQKLCAGKAVEYAIQLCNIIAYMNDNHTYHLDIKPDNIIFFNNNIRLVDYGNAILDVEQPDIRMGTIGYASPEMYGKEKINSGSDVYSIGMVLLYMLTGMNDEGAIRRIGKGRLREIINGCICHSGRERISTARELARRLESIKHNNVENISLNIHVGTVLKHSGCTHCAISLGRIYEMRGQAAIVCEYNDSNDFFKIIKSEDFRFFNGIFRLKNVNLVPDYHGHADRDFLSDYHKIIVDFGVIDENNLESFLSGDINYIVTGKEPYEIDKLTEFCRNVLYPLNNNKQRIVINYADRKQYKQIVRKYDFPCPIRMPYEPDIFNSRKDWLI